MAIPFVRSRVRRALPLFGMLAAALFSASCGTDTTGTDTPGLARLSAQPQFSSSMFAPITLDRVQAIVERITPDSSREGTIVDTLVNVTRNFSPTSDELRVSLSVPLKESRETLRLTLLYFAGTTLLFEGSQDIDVGTGQNPSPEPITMDYVGPGSNATGLIIEPFDTTVTAGSLTPFRAVAIDNQENDVGPFYMKWSVSSSANGASIDAAGRLRAPTQPGTLWVRGLIPNGVDDSVQVTVTGAPGGITIVSGNHQTGQPGSSLELPFVVRVTTSGGAPVPDATVTWAATVGGGGFEVSTTTTDANGESQNLGFLGQNAGINAFTATVAGAGTVTFVANETQTGTTITWLGNTSDVWSNGANWVGGVVPSVLDSVVVPTAQFYPVLDTTPIVGALTMTGNSQLTLNLHGLVIVRNLTLQGNSSLIMTTPNDVVTVGGNALFDGGDSRGNLTSGIISINGNFTQRATNSATSFSASGDHIVSLAGQNSTVSFATPGVTTNTSGFQDFAYSASSGGTLTLGSNVVARGTSLVAFGGAATITSTGGHNFRTGQLSTSSQLPLVFNNVTVTLQDTVVASFFLSQVTFQNMPTNQLQLEVNYLGGTMNLSNITFSTTPVAPNGFYISAADVRVGDADNLLVQVSNSTPASGGAFTQTSGGAVIQWPPPPPP